MTPGHYTELFFLDEATALAAGHRPCAECQRERFNHFRDLWAKANPELAGRARPAAPILDLHHERTAISSHGNRQCISIEHLPDGVFVKEDQHTAYLVLRNQLLRWNPAGYELSTAPLRYPARVLTPASIIHTLAAGYSAGIHPSAFEKLGQTKRLQPA